ncbi:MAG: ATP-dependent helicase, partial [Caldisericum exile]
MRNIIKYKVFGPPGTGKTTWIVHKINELLTENKIRKDRIAAISLTKATKWALLEKLFKEGIDLQEESVRTMHSWAYKLLCATYKTVPLVSCIDLASFFSQYKMNYVCSNKELETLDLEENPFLIEQEDIGNLLYQSFNKLRLKYPFPDESKVRAFFKEEDITYISENTFVKIYFDYMEFLEEKKLFDFTSLLEKALENEMMLAGDLLVIDEFQDFGALHNLLIDKWLEHFRYSIAAGDDDQAIFEFAGSNAKFLIEAKSEQSIVLPKSYRLPLDIHKEA